MESSEKLMDLKSLEMAKKRDHKIMITDEAIAKVPFVQYREIPEEEYPIIQMLARKVLQLSKDENDSNEVAITYSMDSFSYHLIRSSKACVVVSLHNHPSLSKISLVDVRFFLENSAVKLLTVVTNLGSIYYLAKGSSYSRSKAVAIFNESVEKNNEAEDLKALQKASDYFLKNCYKAGIVYENR